MSLATRNSLTQSSSPIASPGFPGQPGNDSSESDTSTPLPSLADRVRPITAGGSVVGVIFSAETPVFVLGEELLLFAPEDGEKRVAVHPEVRFSPALLTVCASSPAATTALGRDRASGELRDPRHRR